MEFSEGTQYLILRIKRLVFGRDWLLFLNVKSEWILSTCITAVKNIYNLLYLVKSIGNVTTDNLFWKNHQGVFDQDEPIFVL
jgi:hypothetical protein